MRCLRSSRYARERAGPDTCRLLEEPQAICVPGLSQMANYASRGYYQPCDACRRFKRLQLCLRNDARAGGLPPSACRPYVKLTSLSSFRPVVQDIANLHEPREVRVRRDVANIADTEEMRRYEVVAPCEMVRPCLYRTAAHRCEGEKCCVDFFQLGWGRRGKERGYARGGDFERV